MLACGPFTENKERIQKLKETADTAFIYKNQLDKVCFSMIWLTEILQI